MDSMLAANPISGRRLLVVRMGEDLESKKEALLKRMMHLWSLDWHAYIGFGVYRGR